MPIPDLHHMMGALIAAPSVSSVLPHHDQGNRAVLDLLAGWLEALHFNVEILPLDGTPHKANLIATWGQGPGGLVLAGHTDTVPYDDGRWRHDPFDLWEHDGRWYGLGIADMKGFFALALDTLRTLDTRALKQPLTVIATADEETSMAGARALAATGRAFGRHVILGEPTDLKPVRQHKGICMQAIRIEGRSGHSSDPALGANALEGMHRVIGALLAWRSLKQQRYRDPAFHVPVPTLNLGHIHGGDNANRICGRCELHFDLRPLPGMDLTALRAELDARVHQAVSGMGLAVECCALFEGIPALTTPADSALVRTVEALTDSPAGAAAFGTEGPYFQALGMDVLVWGPGGVAQAHQPDEYLELARVPRTLELLQEAIIRLCGSD